MKIDITEINTVSVKKDEILIFRLPEETPQDQIYAFRKRLREEFPQISDRAMIIAGKIEIDKYEFVETGLDVVLDKDCQVEVNTTND